MKPALILAVLLALPGCSAVSAVTSVATLPVRAAAKTVDATTTSQSERDQRRGREMRLEEERLGALDREYRRQSARCDEGDSKACARRDAAWQALQAQQPGQPSQPR